MTISTLTVGGEDYTSYASLAEANKDLTVDPVRAATWTGKTDDEKKGYLVAATRRLNLLPWSGEKAGAYDTQDDAFPRTGLTYSDGTSVTSTDAPYELRMATTLLAGSIAVDPTAADHGTDGTNVKSAKAGSAQVTFFRPSAGVPMQERTSYELIKQWLEGGAVGSAYGPLASGTGSDSQFDDIDEWGRGSAFP